MKRKHFILAAVAIVVAAVLLAWAMRPEVVTTRVVLSGQEGLAVTGSYTADGKEHAVRETLPAEITAKARRLTLVVASADQAKDIAAKVFVNGKPGVSGAHRHLRIEVTGQTPLRSKPQTFLRAY